MEAIEAVGKSKPNDDWALAPSLHADSLPPEASPLINILRNGRVDVIIKKFKDADEKAKSAQNYYKKFSTIGILTASSATLIGSILLFFKSSFNSSSPLYEIFNICEPWMLLLEAFAIAMAALFFYLVKHNKYYFEWMLQRAKAESERIRLFEFVCLYESNEVEKNESIKVYQLQLEYFRRYQLEVQLRFYKGRSEQHKISASKFVSFGGIITFFVVLAAALTGVFSSNEMISTIALIGISAPVIFTAHENIKLISQDERNSIRYTITYDHLLELSGDLPEIRQKVSKGDRHALNDYVKSINNEISVEHREWLASQRSVKKPSLEIGTYMEE